MRFFKHFTYFPLVLAIKEDYNIEKYKEMVKVVCKIEHGCLIGGDIVKEAAKLSSVEAFDQVSWTF